MYRSIIGKTFIARDDKSTFTYLDKKIMQTCHDYFIADRKDRRIKIMMDIISRKSKVSMRILDWFLSNYCMEKMVEYEIRPGVTFNVYNSYRTQLQEYRKHRFDP